MRKMKESGIDWIGKIPEEWLLVKYKRFCDVYAGGTPDTAKSEYYDGEIPWIQSGKIQNCDITDCSRYITELGVKNSSTKFIPQNTALLAMTGATCGNVGFSKMNLYANQSVMAFVNTNELDARFIYYSLFIQKDGILINQNGSAQAGINVENGKNLYVPYPSVKEQVKISEVLDKKTSEIDNVIEKTKETIEDYKTLKNNVISKAVTQGIDKNTVLEDTNFVYANKVLKGSKIVKLRNLVTKPITDGTHTTPEYTDRESGSPFLSSKDVTKGRIDWSSIKYITNDLHEILYKNTRPQKDDILLAKNGTTGIGALVEDDRIFDIYVTLALIRPNTKLVLPKYLLYAINSNISKKQFDEHLIGIGVPNLHLNVINNTKIIVHNLEEQKRIVNYLDKKLADIDELITNKQNIIDELEQYKKSLIYEYVTGKKEVV